MGGAVTIETGMVSIPVQQRYLKERNYASTDAEPRRNHS